MTWIYNEAALTTYKQKYGITEEDLQVVEEETDEQGEAIVAETPKVEEKNAKSKLNVQRYKGLGEMNPEQLWETTMNPENRVLKRITIEDAEKAAETFDILMGSEVAPRKKFIQTHAKNVKNLDI